MPIEIRELVIRTRIEERPSSGHALAEDERDELKRGLIEQCVAKVLRTLERRGER